MTQMQVPLPPEESIKHYVTPVGFKWSCSQPSRNWAASQSP